MNNLGSFFLWLVVAYICGSIPFGKLVGIYKGIDIQKHGSKNIGFANAVRVLGWRSGALVLIGDTIKGFAPVIVAKQYLNIHQLMIVALAAILGHIFPLWLRLKGGKGIATGLGITLALSPTVGILAILVYLLCFAVFKKSAPSSMIASCSLPLLCLAFLPQYVLFYVGLAILALWTHRSNIQQMRKHAIHAQ
jgi:acyl phosphate:glycerol-3-phosphate acyltransferase